jgi:hypothetical protein
VPPVGSRSRPGAGLRNLRAGAASSPAATTPHDSALDDGGGFGRALPYSHFFHLKNKMGTTAASTISASAHG